MSSIAWITPPAHGHLNPVLPVLKELIARGERVTCYNTEEFRETIERTGASFRRYPATVLSSDSIAASLEDGSIANSMALLLRSTEELLPFTLRELGALKPDVVVFDSIALWGRMAATVLRLRAVASITHLLMDVEKLSRADQFLLLRQALPKVPGMLLTRRRLIRRYGRAYPPSRPAIPVRASLNVAYTVPELQPHTSMIDDTFRFVGPSINPQTRPEDFPFDELGRDPVIYISLGTVHSRDPEFYRTCFEALGSIPRQFVLSVGHHVNSEAVGRIPDNFIVRPSVPQLEVLKRADVFITHGGINSILEGLYYGVPLILIPHQFEQLMNARCVADRGAGVIIDARIRRKPVTSVELRRTLETALADPGLRKAATVLQASLQRSGGYSEAASLIQAHASRPNAERYGG